MSIELELNRQFELANWIDKNLSCKCSVDKAGHLALACFDLSIEHHAAICSLASSGLFGSAYSLLRVQFEALIRGLWLRHVATENELAVFEKKDEPPISPGSLIKAVEESVGLPDSLLSEVKSKKWGLLCSFTHSGHQALIRRANETQTGAVNYRPLEVISVLHTAGAMATLAGVELASLTQKPSIIGAAMEKAKEYADQQAYNNPRKADG